MLAFLQPLREALAALASDTSDAPSPVVLASGAVAAVLVAAVLLSCAIKKRAPGKPLPQPRTTLPVIGNTLDFLNNNDVFHDWIASLVEEFNGDAFVLKASSRPDMIVISTPEAFEDVSKTQYDNFGKGEYQFELFNDVLGTALTIVDGERWRYQRKIFANLFSARQLRDVMQPVIRKHARTLLSIYKKASDSGKPLDLFRLFNRFTMESFSEIGFGIQMGSLGKEEAHPFETAFDAAQEISTRRFSLPLWYWKLERLLNFGPEAELKRYIETIKTTALGFINESIEKRNRGERSDAKNIVSLVLDSVDASEVVDPELLRSIVIASLAAGRDTTSQTLSWFVHVITQHPDVEEKIRQEVLAKIPALATDENYLPTMEDVQDLTYLEACIKEVMRFYPAVPFNLRHSAQDTYLSDGTFIPAGTDVGIPYWSMGRRASIWGDDCGEFKPERFLDPETGKLLHLSPFKFNFFHAGPRSCLGMNLALMEMKMLVSALLSRYHVVPEPGQTITYNRSITLPMRNPFMVRFEKVSA
jgi:cytochrome P450